MSDDDRYFDDGVIARFLVKIEFRGDDECWPWKAGRTSDGYGIFCVRKPHIKTAHRYMAEVVRRERLPYGMDASHTCHNRLCVNPRHILVESHRDNCLRRTNYARKGVPSPRRKLTWEQALDIRSSRSRIKDLSEYYKVNPYTIWAIKHGVIYKVP